MNAAYSSGGSLDPAHLIERLRSKDEAVRGPAWQRAGPVGAAGVEPLLQAMGDEDFETARAARRALWNVVDHAGRPGAESERDAVVGALLAAFERDRIPGHARREWLWMLSVIGDARVVDVLAASLAEPELREDARCALQRIPGGQATRALREALGRADEEFAPAIADALRARGEVVLDRPSRRLVPTRRTGTGS